MATNFSSNEISAAAKAANLKLSDEEANSLANGGKVTLDGSNISSAEGGCIGIKIVDLGKGCGLYLGFPPSVSVCCTD